MQLNESIVTFETYTWLTKMPAASKQQQKFMGIVRAIQKGDAPASKFSKKARDAAKSMSKKSVKKYAQTKHDDLPKKVRSVNEVSSMINKIANNHMNKFDNDIKTSIKDIAKTDKKKA